MQALRFLSTACDEVLHLRCENEGFSVPDVMWEKNFEDLLCLYCFIFFCFILINPWAGPYTGLTGAVVQGVCAINACLTNIILYMKLIGPYKVWSFNIVTYRGIISQYHAASESSVLSMSPPESK